MRDDELVKFARGALEILRESIALYDRGQIVFYRVMAVELRLLLCDTTRRHDESVDLSLLRRLLPDLTLPELDEAGEFRQEGGLRVGEWLDQEISLERGQQVTLRQLIRQVCDQDGGAHLDRRRRSGLQAGSGQQAWMRKTAWAVAARLEQRLADAKQEPGEDR